MDIDDYVDESFYIALLSLFGNWYGSDVHTISLDVYTIEWRRVFETSNTQVSCVILQPRLFGLYTKETKLITFDYGYGDFSWFSSGRSWNIWHKHESKIKLATIAYARDPDEPM